MHKASPKNPYSRLAIAACVSYFLIGQAFIPRLGIEDDESLFAMPILKPKSAEYILRIGHSHFPLMLMSYLGTLKTLIYDPVVRVFGTGVWATREPMLIAGALSIWLFYLLLRRIAGERTAIAGCMLLSLDTLYLLTSVFDWGPVALQHLLFLGGAYLLVRFYQERRGGFLAAGCCAFGLALWDKALAEWLLSGLAISMLLFYWRQIRAVLTLRRAGVAVLAFCIGALPLILYNVENSGITFRSNFKRETDRFPVKAQMFVDTVRGSGLLGYLTDEDWQTPAPHAPSNFLEKASTGLSDRLKEPRNNLMFYGLLAAVLLAPFAGRAAFRLVLFCVVAMAIAWVQMAITAGAGGSVHHTMLLWPLPILVIAAALAGASYRLRGGAWALTGAIAVLGVSCLLTTNTYYRMMLRNGGSISWTDAVNPLSRYLLDRHASAVYCVDWGVTDNLRLLSDGALPLAVGTDDLSPGAVQAMVSDPTHVFVDHTADFEAFPENNRRLLAAAHAAGYEREPIRTISDSYGRPTFQIYRFLRGAE